MRLGKALATGVAEEQVAPQAEELRLPDELTEETAESKAPAPEEVPVAR
ncbi:hypothetical protein [Streptomyces sp. SAS_270]